MTCTVKIENGAIRFPPSLHLLDGAEVPLTVPDAPASDSFAGRYAACIRAADDLPAGCAQNLDPYAHGHRKQP